jgi:hypothetical protein
LTCIAGLISGGKVYMGGDSAGVADWSMTVRADAKVFRKGEFVFGFTTSFRMGQLIAHAFTPPPVPKKRSELDRYMVVDFVDSVRALFKAGGFATTKDGSEQGGSFLVGVRGRLYHVASDYQVGLTADRLHAVGCGADLAIGALLVNGHLKPEARLRQALRAAERRSAGVRGPFRVVSV